MIFPIDIWKHIINYIDDIDTLLQLSLVCKTFDNIIRNKELIISNNMTYINVYKEKMKKSLTQIYYTYDNIKILYSNNTYTITTNISFNQNYFCIINTNGCNWPHNVTKTYNGNMRQLYDKLYMCFNQHLDNNNIINYIINIIKRYFTKSLVITS